MAWLQPTSVVSIHKASDSGLRAHLHPLVLLTISDFITRHILRQRKDPVVGAIIGQQSGRDISFEHAFECQVVPGDQGAVTLHQTWFQDRLQQYKDVHKAPALELVGWFTTAPSSGPQGQHVPIHQQIIHDYNETALLLAFHPSSVLEGAAVGGKLPLTIYESVYESGQDSSKASKEVEDDGAMEVEGHDSALELKFREVPYTVETGEAEMISVDFVARGGGNATAVDGTAKKGPKAQALQGPSGDTLRDLGPPRESKAVPDSSILSPEDEERMYKSIYPVGYSANKGRHNSHCLPNGTSKRSENAPHPHPTPEILPANPTALISDRLAASRRISSPNLLQPYHNQPPHPPLHPSPHQPPSPPHARRCRSVRTGSPRRAKRRLARRATGEPQQEHQGHTGNGPEIRDRGRRQAARG